METRESGDAVAESPALAASAGASSSSLKRRAIASSLWVLSGNAAGQLLRLCTNPVLAHLLSESAFGLMLLVNALMRGLAMFSDIGLGSGVIYHQRGDDPRFLNTVWTLQVIRGFVLWGAASILALPFARFYGNSQLGAIIPVFATITIVQGFRSPRVFSLLRHLAPRRLTLINLTSQVTGAVVMIFCAFAYKSVWAFVAGGVIASLVTTSLSHLAIPGESCRFCWDWSVRRDLFEFGRWIFLSTMFTFVATSSDRLILGKLHDIDTLGLYGVALALAELPRTALTEIANQVLLPALATVHRTSDRASYSFRMTRQIYSDVAILATISVACVAPFIFYLYPHKYAACSRLTQLLLISIWFWLLDMPIRSALVSRGNSTAIAASNFVWAAVTPIATLGGHFLAGIEGFIVGLAVAALTGHSISVIFLARLGESVLISEVRDTLRFCLAYSFAMSAPFVLDFWLGDAHPLLVHSVALVMSICAAVFITFKSVSILWRLLTDSTDGLLIFRSTTCNM